MFCIKCGAAVADNDAFCSVCGHAQTGEPQAGYGEHNNAGQMLAPKKTSGFKPKYATIAAAALVVLICGYFGGRLIIDEFNYRADLAIAKNAMDSLLFADSVELYRKALAERPDDQFVCDMLDLALEETLSSGLRRAKGFADKGWIEEAINILEELPILRGDKQYNEYREHIKALSAKPSLAVIDSSEFPKILIFINTETNDVEADGLSVSDGGKSVSALKTSISDRNLLYAYTAEDSPDGGEYREVALTLTIGEFEFPLSGEYTTPELQDAAVTLVSTDFSDYPTVRAFFHIKDMLTDQHVENISTNSFTINERVSGGAYVAREVRSAEPMVTAGGKYGINISLVADKSDSIGGEMAKIKTVMREFVGSLALDGGDRAELIAFDDVPQLMCTFTDDATLLNNGINNMATDGATAFYSAVYQGVRNAALQGGARCVIAFTDGEDNRSLISASDVIRFANEKQVPLYIIGVGNKNSSSHDTMRTMASETHGHYWYIDDLYDLTEIYAQIYSELLELYVVSYESDEAADPLAERGLAVSVRGGGYKGTVDTVFTPARTATGGGGSRYEIFVEDVSWEEASARCLERGGHLVTITSKAEEEQIIALAEGSGAKYVWLGGYTSYDGYNNVFGHWITGEDFTYQNWMEGEPSRSDRDGTPEWYLMLWNIASAGGWCWNDQRVELVSEFPQYKGKLAYVCEYEL